MEDTKIMSMPEAMQVTGLPRKKLEQLASMPGCPVLPRKNYERFHFVREPFLAWLEGLRYEGKGKWASY